MSGYATATISTDAVLAPDGTTRLAFSPGAMAVTAASGVTFEGPVALPGGVTIGASGMSVPESFAPGSVSLAAGLSVTDAISSGSVTTSTLSPTGQFAPVGFAPVGFALGATVAVSAGLQASSVSSLATANSVLQFPAPGGLLVAGGGYATFDGAHSWLMSDGVEFGPTSGPSYYFAPAFTSTVASLGLYCRRADGSVVLLENFTCSALAP